MRLGAFFLISIALHSAAMTYPVLFLSPSTAELIPVVVLSLGDGSGKEAPGDRRAEGKRARPARPRDSAPVQTAEERDNDERMSSAEQSSSEALPSFTAAAAGTAIPRVASQAETGGRLAIQPEHGNGGDGLSSGNGNLGSGPGYGVGTGGGHGGANFVAANYVYNPKPEYPDRARREGREGQVVLRVLVDEEGRSKLVEVNRSSGSAALDQAAAQTIKRWRFSPARFGDRPIETWVRIPVDFRLTGAKD
jgi:protein TonB